MASEPSQARTSPKGLRRGARVRGVAVLVCPRAGGLRRRDGLGLVPAQDQARGLRAHDASGLGRVRGVRKDEVEDASDNRHGPVRGASHDGRAMAEPSVQCKVLPPCLRLGGRHGEHPRNLVAREDGRGRGVRRPRAGPKPPSTPQAQLSQRASYAFARCVRTSGGVGQPCLPDVRTLRRESHRRLGRARHARPVPCDDPAILHGGHHARRIHRERGHDAWSLQHRHVAPVGQAQDGHAVRMAHEDLVPADGHGGRPGKGCLPPHGARHVARVGAQGVAVQGQHLALVRQATCLGRDGEVTAWIGDDLGLPRGR